MTGGLATILLRWAAAAAGGTGVYLALRLVTDRRSGTAAGLWLSGSGRQARLGEAAQAAVLELSPEARDLAALAGWTPGDLLAWHRRRRLWVVLGAGSGMASGLWAGSGGWGLPALAPAVLGGVVGWWLAGHRLREAASRRQAELRRQLPAVLERYVLGVTAGLSVRQSLRLAAQRSTGALGDLLARVVGRLDVGADLGRAIEPELSGVEAGPVRLVLTALMQAERLGASLLDTAREQAEFVRRLAGYEAERSVDALPVKLMVCAIVFLFPPVVVVVLLPNLILFLRSQW